MVVAIIVITLWSVVTTCLYAGEFARRRSSERMIEVEAVRTDAVASITSEHDKFLRGLIERGYDFNAANTEQQQAIIDRLLQGPDIQPAEPVGLADERLDIPPDMTADWTDFDPTLWEPQGPQVVGGVPKGFPVPDIEEMNLDG